MNAHQLLKSLHRERLTRINTERYVASSKTTPRARRALAEYFHAQRRMLRAERELKDEGYSVHTRFRLRETHERAAAQRIELHAAYQRAEIGLLKAATRIERADVITTFIDETQELLK